MRDAFSGIFNLAIIIVFFVVAIGVLGLTVNYAKAFRAKNIILDTMEEYYFGATCFHTDGACFKRIKEQTDSISYHPHNLNCPPEKSASGWYEAPLEDDGTGNGLFCYYYHMAGSSEESLGEDFYFSVITQVDIDIPIINKIMGLYFFQVKGDTRASSERHNQY